MEKYDHAAVERKWQEKWKESEIYKTVEDPAKPKTYVLDMFPYPSGEGLHVGHPKGYIATDIYSRAKRMQGNVVLHPMGWDAFGLPAENFAIKNKVHPRVAVEKNIATFKEQLAHIGFDYDWSREINTTDPAYYKWTQWIFLKMLEHGLAYQSNEPINWCPSCMTGLANEDLDNGVCERCGTTVIKKKLPQWVLKITDYADRLLKDLDTLDWPEHIKESQRNWIGRSEGAEMDFPVGSEKVTIFTTRPDTIYGATYLVLAPEHELISKLSLENKGEVAAYVAQAIAKTEIERSAEGKEKTGVELKGVKAINPATKEELPIFVADYVLGGYGTGAIMAVPAHDERDYEFAKKFNLPIRQVIEPTLVQTEGSSAFREGEPYADHRGIIAIVKHWAEEKYLALGWKTAPDWGTLLTGSIDEGMSPEDTVLKEIREETGYKNPRIARPLGQIHGKYFHGPKNANRYGHAPAFYVELENEAREEVAEEEQQKHILKWLSLAELKKFLTPLSHRTAVELFEQGVYTGPGLLVNSGGFDGRDNREVAKEIVEAAGGRMVVRYKIRDWVFSRQRYWGEPIPVIHCEKDGVVPVPYEDLPVKLPEVDHYEPSGTGESPLAAIEEWVNVSCPKCKGPAKRETNTMPQWAGSSWYYLRFMDPHNDESSSHAAQKSILRRWMCMSAATMRCAT
jgi:leucyl-tRNA synthetase